MIGIDTNILIRYLTQDDVEQAKTVEALLDKYLTKPKSVLINNIVMCKLVWVLDRGYKYSKNQIIEVVRQILSTEEFAFENQKVLWLALEQFEKKRLDFSDILIGQINKDQGCEYTFTFDKLALEEGSVYFSEA
jgi:predicted nucleic-acid-binding protein